MKSGLHLLGKGIPKFSHNLTYGCLTAGVMPRRSLPGYWCVSTGSTTRWDESSATLTEPALSHENCQKSRTLSLLAAVPLVSCTPCWAFDGTQDSIATKNTIAMCELTCCQNPRILKLAAVNSFHQ